jgi:hypothetical protein
MDPFELVRLKTVAALLAAVIGLGGFGLLVLLAHRLG